MPFEVGVFLVRAYPDRTDPGRHVSRIDFYVRPTMIENNPDVAEFLSNIATNFSEIIRDEDYVMSTSQQTAANGRSLQHIIFGRNEPALHHYHNTYRRRLGNELLPLLDDADVATIASTKSIIGSIPPPGR